MSEEAKNVNEADATGSVRFIDWLGCTGRTERRTEVPNTMEEFQAQFDHPPCLICGEPMSRSCFCVDLKTWEDCGSWHCQSHEHSHSLKDPERYEAARKRWLEVHNFGAV